MLRAERLQTGRSQYSRDRNHLGEYTFRDGGAHGVLLGHCITTFTLLARLTSVSAPVVAQCFAAIKQALHGDIAGGMACVASEVLFAILPVGIASESHLPRRARW
jgi:hypothetical protein